MATTQVAQELNLKNDFVFYVEKIEQKIAQTIGPQVFDYKYILQPTSKTEIIVKQLSPEAIKLFEEYNSTVHKYFQITGLDFPLEETDTIKRFLELSHHLYLCRFLQARMLFANYSMYRVYTKAEINIMIYNKISKEETFSDLISIEIPDGFVVNSNGRLDFPATIDKENKTNLIKSHLSIIGDIFTISNQFYTDFLNITSRGFLPQQNIQGFIETTNTILEKIMLKISQDVYIYLQRKYGTAEAKDNVTAYYQSLVKENLEKFPKELQQLEEVTRTSLNYYLSEFTLANEESKDEIISDFITLVLYYISKGNLTPHNYYELDYRDQSEFYSFEENYHYLVDIYLLDDFGQSMEMAIETYDIDFSPSAKELIFDAVTNDIENPNFTFEDYLNIL